MLQKLTKMKSGHRKTLAIAVPVTCAWIFTIIEVFWLRGYGAGLFLLDTLHTP